MNKVDPSTLPDYPAIFARNLRAARVKAGLTQRDVASRTGATQQHLSHIEAGTKNVTLRTMALLAEVVGCKLPEMLRDGKAADD